MIAGYATIRTCDTKINLEREIFGKTVHRLRLFVLKQCLLDLPHTALPDSTRADGYRLLDNAI